MRPFRNNPIFCYTDKIRLAHAVHTSNRGSYPNAVARAAPFAIYWIGGCCVSTERRSLGVRRNFGL